MRRKQGPKGIPQSKGVLAVALEQLARVGKMAEDKAAYLLNTVKNEKLVTLEAFDAAIKTAFAALGWNTRPGKPKAGEERRAVPHTVRTYVWEIRSAIREGVDVRKCKTLYELRQARHALKPTPAAATGPDTQATDAEAYPAELRQAFVGVRLTDRDAANGGLWHDAMVLHLRMPADQRAMFEGQVGRVLRKYAGYMPAPAPVEVAPGKAATG